MNQPLQQSSDLPELPTPPAIFDIGRFGIAYSAEQMREYARAAIATTQVVADQPDEAIAKIDKALRTVQLLCDGAINWTMRVPAEADRDPDLIIADALQSARNLLASNAGKASSEVALWQWRSDPDSSWMTCDETTAKRKVGMYAGAEMRALAVISPAPASSEPAVAAIEAYLWQWRSTPESPWINCDQSTARRRVQRYEYAEMRALSVIASTPAITPEK